MATIRCLEISNFRSIKYLNWFPSPGVNCLIGSGDSGKSTILDAIDACLGARRSTSFSDADFYKLDIDNPVDIKITIGNLSDTMKSLDTYGFFLRGFSTLEKNIVDEPEADVEIVLTIRLQVKSDLEPIWSLYSERAEMLGHEGYLNWSDRKLLVPTRIGSFSGYELSLRKGSVLNRLSDEKIDVSSELVRVARSSRKSFGTEINEKVEDIRNKVVSVAGKLGVNVGEDIFAMLDAESVSINGGAISLHDQDGVPLRNMGTGSSRLLVAGLQKEAAIKTSIVLVDELEYGLEPHRILRFLGSLGVKDKTPSMQSFMTTHSPVAVRELAGEQLFCVRNGDGQHSVISFENDDVQGTLRLFPDAFLASSVLVCEGATEIGFLRGFDSFLASKGYKSLFARGIALVDGGGFYEPNGSAGIIL